MIRLLLLSLLAMVAGAFGGYAYALHAGIDVQRGLGSPLGVGKATNLACISSGYAAVFGSFDDTAVRLMSGPSTDKVALSIDAQARQVTMMTGAGVAAGLTSGEKLRIVHADDAVLIAIQVVETSIINGLIVKLDTGRAVWTKASHTLVLNGQAMFLECR